MQGVVSYVIPLLLAYIFDPFELQKTSDNDLVAILALAAVAFVFKVELSYRLQLNTPSGGGFVPRTQMALVEHVTGLPMVMVRTVRAESRDWSSI